MERRHIVITAGAAVAAFAVAFGIGKLTAGEETTAVAPAQPAQAIEMQTAAIEADVEAEALPALKPKPTPEPEEPEPTAAAAAPTTPAPSASAPAPAPAPEPDPGPVTGGGED